MTPNTTLYMDLSSVEQVIRTWSQQTAELGADPNIRYVQVFENKGAMAVVSSQPPSKA